MCVKIEDVTAFTNVFVDTTGTVVAVLELAAGLYTQEKWDRGPRETIETIGTEMGGMGTKIKPGKIKTTPVMDTDREIAETVAITIKVINLAHHMDHKMDHKILKRIFYINIQWWT